MFGRLNVDLKGGLSEPFDKKQSSNNPSEIQLKATRQRGALVATPFLPGKEQKTSQDLSINVLFIPLARNVREVGARGRHKTLEATLSEGWPRKRPVPLEDSRDAASYRSGTFETA